MIGASFRGAPLVAASRRIAKLAARDRDRLVAFGVKDGGAKLVTEATEIDRMMQDPVIRKHDTPIGLAEMQELLAKARGWLIELRERAVINLSHDHPALMRIWSGMPEIADGYPRDALKELDERIAAAKDLAPRLDEVGVNDKFVGRGRKLAAQLRTAIGKEDIEAGNLQFKTRRLYLKKGVLFLELKRVARAGRAAFRDEAQNQGQYHLLELEPDPQSLP